MSLRIVFQKFLILFRSPIKLLYTLLCTTFGFFLALGLRFDFDLASLGTIQSFELPLALLIFFRMLTYSYWQLHEGYWRHVSTKELKELVLAHSFSTILFTASLLLFRVEGFPRSVVAMEYFISVLIAGGSRFFTRLFCEEFLSDAPRDIIGDRKDIVVLGGGNSGHLLVRTLLSQKKLGLRPLFVLDDDERLAGFSVHGVPIHGKLSTLTQVLSTHPSVCSAIVAIPSISRTKLSELETICNSFKVSLKKLQAFEDVALSNSLSNDGNISIESLLDREVTIQHEEEVRKQLRGKIVLVTGAGGSIGSELVRQILPYGPAKLILLDSSEYNLYKIELEIGKLFLEVPKRFIIASVCDAPRLSRIFSDEKPDFIFHAAAYKHVPIMETNCSQAFGTNVLGTWNVLEACATHGAERFVLISTDKAIDPSSVMGCSKRIAEWVVTQRSNELGRNPLPNGKPLSTAIVRFGNVINSNGSVIPLFREQILSGGPITVTHPDIDRYFMAIQEAVRLVLTAGTLGERGDVFVLDMGKKIKIVDIAKKLLTLYGRTDIQITFTGLRPGEKLTENLISEFERTSSTNFEKVQRVAAPDLSFNVLEAIQALALEINRLPDVEIGQQMHKLVQDVRKSLKLNASQKKVVTYACS